MFISILHISQSCNASHFDYISKYTLGKQDELNRTFTKIQSKLNTLKDIKYQNASSYTITNINVSYFYLDSQQKS